MGLWISSKDLEDYTLSCLICHFISLLFTFASGNHDPLPPVSNLEATKLFLSLLFPRIVLPTVSHHFCRKCFPCVVQFWLFLSITFAVIHSLLIVTSARQFVSPIFMFLLLYTLQCLWYCNLPNGSNQVTFLIKNFGHLFSRKSTCSFFLVFGARHSLSLHI